MFPSQKNKKFILGNAKGVPLFPQTIQRVFRMSEISAVPKKPQEIVKKFLTPRHQAYEAWVMTAEYAISTVAIQ